MVQVRLLSADLDLKIRDADRSHKLWEASGDILQRHSGKLLGRVYGRGATRLAAEEEVAREAERWLAQHHLMGR